MACSEDLTTTSACGGLCPEQQLTVSQVELQPVVSDTTLVGFPLRGTETFLLAARAGDTLDTRAVYRFDSLPRFTRNTAGDSLPVQQVFAPVLEVLVARRGQSLVPSPVTLTAYDVDVAGDDTSAAALVPAFTPARRLGAATVQPRAASDTTSADTLRIPLDTAVLGRKIRADSVLRVGIRVTDPAQARVLLAPVAARVVFRVGADTGSAKLSVTPTSKTPAGQPQLQIDLSSFTLTVAGTPAPAAPVLVVGGLPGRRSLLRFALPPAIVDSATVLRATLVLTQRPVRGYVPGDTLRLQPLAITSSVPPVTDIWRRVQLASNGVNPFSGNRVLTTVALPLAPGDSGQVLIQMAELVGAWRSAGGLGFPPELVLASVAEGYSPLQVQFYSSEAAAELRPRLRLSYVRRINFLLP